MEQTGFDPKRRLCPDGSCVGVINPDGRCSVCARTAEAAAAGQAMDEESWAERPAGTDGPAGTHGRTDGSAPAVGPADIDSPAPPAGADLAASGFDPRRRLCEDGSCVGVIGADGACTVCGLKPGA